MSPQNYIIRYLDKARIMQVATASNGSPWCCSLYFAHDNSHNLYWISLPDARHSQEIVRNPHVAGTIVLPQNYGDLAHGVQFEGTARAITDPDELRSLAQAYSERYSMNMLANDMVKGTNTYRLYQIKPSKFTLFDIANFPNHPEQVWHVPESSYNKDEMPS